MSAKFLSIRSFCALLLLAFAIPAAAIEFQLGPIEGTTSHRVTLGVAWRVESRDPALIGKLNLNPDLCPDGCMSLSGDSEPNQRLVDAPGAFVGHEQDDGNLNYDRGDLVAGLVKWTGEVGLYWDDWFFKARAIGFYDAVNTDFDERHANTQFQPARVRRDRDVEDLVGKGLELHDLFFGFPLSLGENDYDLFIGNQVLRWGEANITLLNSLAEINPLDGRRLHQPGFQINELFLPVPMAVLSGDLASEQGLSIQAFYQFGWRPVIADPGGSFYGDADPLYRDKPTAIFGLGNYPEDPQRRNRIPNDLAALLTQTSFTTRFLDEKDGYAKDDGQYGVRLTWLSDFIWDSTEWNFHAMNYHSRLPYVSARAAERSCLRDASGTSWVDYVVACEGFDLLGGKEPLPLDTMRLLLEYPEDIQLYGASFNTTMGDWSVAGEYAFRPNLPLQVHAADVTWAALQPGFPAEDIIIGTEQLLGTTGSGLDALLGSLLGPVLGPVTGGFPITIPGARSALPDLIETEYRGNKVRGGQYIRGYERFAVDQLVINGIRIFGSSNPVANFLGTEQILMMLELGVTHIWGLPSPQALQLESGSPNATHVKPGADGTGQPDGQPDPRLQNPTQQKEAFVTEWSWGYRALFQLEYNNVFSDITMKPFALIAHDVDGISPRPMQNFIEGRLDAVLGLEALFTQQLSAKLQYNLHTGDRHYSRRDRDNVALEVSWNW